MPKIELHCEWCGKTLYRYPSLINEHNFCSKACLGKFSSKAENPNGYQYRDFSINSARMSKTNAELNKTRMTDETRKKLSEAHRKTHKTSKYRKMNGRHEHRIVAETMLGRSLLPGEVVHHIDGNSLNNDPSNLLVLPSQAEHARIHHAKKVVS